MSPRDGEEGIPSADKVHVDASVKAGDAFLSNGSTSKITKTRRVTVRRKTQRKHDVPFAMFREWIVQHQIGLAINLLVLLAMVHTFLPRAREHTRKFLELSYFDEKTGYYAPGRDDIYLVIFWIVAFTGIRAAMMEYALVPFAEYCGIKTSKVRTRFAEQAWSFIYAVVFWSLGMHLYYNSNYWLNFREFWMGWPHKDISGLFKWYYLVQFAFWLQQILVVNIEERRKDFHQMFTHHIVTCLLIFGSYSYHHMRVGNFILCIMDVVDVLLPVTKMLNYLRLSTACDITFVIFMIVWFLARHVCFVMVCWSIYSSVQHIIPYACFSSVTGKQVSDLSKLNSVGENIMQPFLDPEGPVCFNNKIRLGFLGTLLALQVITIMWYILIVRIAWRVIRGGNADDDRSDEDEEEEVAEELEEHHQDQKKGPSEPLLEEEVGVESISFKNRGGSAWKTRKAQASASGVTLPGHSDRKELLGRIGCDKTT